MRKVILISIISLVLTGCVNEVTSSVEQAEAVDSVEIETKDVVIEEYDGDPVDTHDVIYTLNEVMTLTFDRILPKEELNPLLDKLDEHEIKAVFFGSFSELISNPNAVDELIQRGHQIENDALYQMDLAALDYDEIYRLVKLTNEQIETMTGKQTKYIRTQGKKTYENLNKVAGQLEMSGVINFSHPFKEIESNEEEKIKRHARRAVARGGVISMNPKNTYLIPYIAEAVKEVDFDFLLLDELVALDEKRKSFKEIAGSDAIQKNNDKSNVEPYLHYQEETDQKEVALTFDDWASEVVVLEVLDILEEYDIKSTFYLKTSIVPENPNLARLLIERGHEVANHTHSHKDSTTLSFEDLQEDVYQAHKIITEAIQEQPKLYFRPPFGRIDDESAQAIAAMGFDALGMYDLSSYDWNDEYTEADVVDRVMTNVQPGSVIVMHILDDIHTPSVLPDVIESLQSEGYEFVLTSKWIEG